MFLLLTYFLQSKAKGKTIYLLKQSAKKSRKITKAKQYPVLAKDKRQTFKVPIVAGVQAQQSQSKG